MEAGNYVGYLDAGIVDVILDLHGPAGGAQHADEGVTQNRIAEVTDMRGFVGIDIGVLDDDLAWDRLAGLVGGVQDAVAIRAAVQPDVDVAVAGDFERGDAFDGSQSCDQLGRDGAWSLLQLPGQMERYWDRQFAERRLLGLFQGAGGLEALFGLFFLGDARGNLLFDGMKHVLSVCTRYNGTCPRLPLTARPLNSNREDCPITSMENPNRCSMFA